MLPIFAELSPLSPYAVSSIRQMMPLFFDYAFIEALHFATMMLSPQRYDDYAAMIFVRRHTPLHSRLLPITPLMLMPPRRSRQMLILRCFSSLLIFR